MEAFLTSTLLVALAERLPMKLIRYLAAAMFIATGLATIVWGR